MWGVCTHICSNKLERVALLSLVELSTRLAAPRANSQAVGLWGFGFVQGVIKVALTLILPHFITCPEEAKFVPRISHIPYQTLTYSFWPYFLCRTLNSVLLASRETDAQQFPPKSNSPLYL